MMILLRTGVQMTERDIRLMIQILVMLTRKSTEILLHNNGLFLVNLKMGVDHEDNPSSSCSPVTKEYEANIPAQDWYSCDTDVMPIANSDVENKLVPPPEMPTACRATDVVMPNTVADVSKLTY